MVDKKRIIDETIKLLRWGQKMPIFAIKYTISAMDSEIENFISDTTDEYDWDGRLLSDADYEARIRQNVERFRNSSDYVKDGFSKMTITQCVRVSDIGFEFVRDILEGEKIGILCDVVGEIELVDYQI